MASAKPFAIALLIAVTSGSADAAVAVIGSGYAKSCFEAADKGRKPREALRICDSALMDKDLAVNDRAATLVNRGIIRMQAQNLSAAIEDYDAAIKLLPDAAEAYVNKGIALVRIGGRDGEAVELLTKAIARDPLRPEIAFYTRAVAHESLGRVREAYEDYSRAAQLAPQWTEPAEQLQRFQTVRRKTAGV